MNHARSLATFLKLTGVFAVALTGTARAGPWKSEPQPLVAGPLKTGPRYVVTATPGSNLAFDSGWRILWSVSANSLTGHIWNRAKYFERIVPAPQLEEMFNVGNGSNLVVDPSWHIVYFVSPDGRLRAMQNSPAGWLVTETIPGNVSQVLAVHPLWHTVFAYDSASRSLLAVYWSATELVWKSDVISSDLGDAPAEGVIDAKRHILYTTHQDAPSLGVPAVTTRLQPWPLVATWWDGFQWKSQVIASTGVPQRPAYVASEDRVYYSNRADLEGLRWFKPSQGKLVTGERKYIPDLLTKGTFSGSTAPAYGERVRWNGAQTWIDDQRYTVNLQVRNYLSDQITTSGVLKGGNLSVSLSGGTLALNDGFGLSIGFVGGGWGNYNEFGVFSLFGSPPYQPPPHVAVSAHVPLWETAETAAAGLRQFRAMHSQKRGEIIQQRVSEGAWNLTRATSWQAAPNIFKVPGETLYYRLGPGVVTTKRKHYELFVPNGGANGQNGWDPVYTYAWVEVPGGEDPPVITVDGVGFLDPAHAETVTTVPSDLKKPIQELLGKGAVEADAATLPAELEDLEETSASMLTFGHKTSSASPKSLAPGGRFQSYDKYQLSAAKAGGIACDASGSLAFYVQAPSAAGGECWIVVVY